MKNRRFAIPAVCSIGLHAALIFGFKAPTPLIIALPDTIFKPSATLANLVREKPEPLPADRDEDATDQIVVAKLGTPRPSIIDEPMTPGPGDITIEVSPPGPQSVGRIDRIGEIGVAWGKPNGEDITGVGGSRIVDVKALDRTPTARFQPGPSYPTEARREGTSGEVVLDFVVAETGDVTHVTVVRSTHFIFEEPARRAVARWRFEPGRRNGQVVSFRMRQPISFNLNGE